MNEERLVRRRMDDDRERRWVVLGRRGAVEYHEHIDSGMAVGIELHAPHTVDPDAVPQRCHILETGCYLDGPGVFTTRSLQQRYRDAGDEEVVWAELEQWYRAEDWPRPNETRATP